MKCNLCQNEATVHTTLTMRYTSLPVDLCVACATAHGVNSPTGFSSEPLLRALRSRPYTPPEPPQTPKRHT